MAEDEQLPDPNTPEWSIAWAAKEALRRYLGPKFDGRLPLHLADAIGGKLLIVLGHCSL